MGLDLLLKLPLLISLLLGLAAKSTPELPPCPDMTNPAAVVVPLDECTKK